MDSWTWGHTSLTSACWRSADLSEFKASFVYTVSYRPARAIQPILLSKSKQTKEKKNKQKPPCEYNKSEVIKPCFFIFIISLPLFILSLLFSYKIASTTGAVSEVSTSSFYPPSYWISLLNSFFSHLVFHSSCLCLSGRGSRQNHVFLSAAGTIC